MIVATRLSAVWQVAGVAAAALCCYLVSQSVATERASLERVDRQIAQTHDDIAKLQTEIGVRARMGQLESWNRQVLALQAPRPAQFVASGVQLAALYGHHDQPALQLDPSVAGQQGSPTTVAYHPAQPSQVQRQLPVSVPAVPAPAPDAVPAQSMLHTASFVRPAPNRLGDAQGAPLPVPALQKASLEVIKTAPVEVKHAPQPHKSAASAPKTVEKSMEKAHDKPKGESKPKAEPIRLAARDPLPRSLLPADIGALAAREARGSKDSSKATR
jgi:hypothetical protein